MHNTELIIETVEGTIPKNITDTLNVKKIKEYSLLHQRGMLEFTNEVKFNPKDCDVGVQIAEDGRIWICVDGQALIRFKPNSKNSKNSLSLMIRLLISDPSAFIKLYGTDKGRKLANRLQLKGKGSVKLANAISNYCWNLEAAHTSNNNKSFYMYLDIVDRIYDEDIKKYLED